MRSSIVGLLLLSSLAHAASGVSDSRAINTPYTVQKQFMLGGSGGWDYLTLDQATNLLFIARSDRVLVMNTSDGAIVATIADTPGVHGVALAPEFGRGFTSNGRADTVTVFDLKSFKTIATIPISGQGPDTILYDKFSKHVYTFNGRSQDVSVIDPLKDTVIATIAVGGRPEFALTDDAGRIFVNVEDTSQLLVIDSLAVKQLATWPLKNCNNPTGLALDAAHQRLFSTCRNGVMAVTDVLTGKHIAEVPIGKGPDAAAFDAERNLIFSSNGQDGTLTIVHEDDPDRYSVIANVVTKKSARTMALDPKTHRVYLTAGDFEAPPAASADQPRPRPTMIDGSFKVLVVGN